MSDIIFTLGNTKNPDILVVCDLLNKEALSKGVPIPNQHLNLFSAAAESYGFSKEDFCFINCGPILPEELQKATPKKKKDFILTFREEFLSVYSKINPKITIISGANAGLQVTGKEMKITKERGVVKELVEGRFFLPMLSPAHILKQPEVKDIFYSDFNMLKKLKSANYSNSVAMESTIELKYEWRDDISDILQNRPKIISFDTETTGLQWYKPTVVPITLQMSHKPGTAIVSCVNPLYKPISEEKLKVLISQWKELLEDPKVLKVGHNIQYDNHIARKLGINIKGWAFDTLLMAHALDENMLQKDLEECCRRWLPEMAGYKDFYNNTLDKSNMMGVSYEDMLMYGGGDADASLRLAKVMFELLKQDSRQFNVYRKVTLPATLSFGNVIEKYGISIDENALANLGIAFSNRVKTLEEEMFDMIPTIIKQKYIDDLKLTKSRLLIDILFTEDGFGLEPKKFTDATKMPATNEEHLKMFEGHEFVDRLLEFKKLQKMITTYVGVKQDEKGIPTGFWKYIFEGKIRPSYSLYTTVTGRTSCLTGDVEVRILRKGRDSENRKFAAERLSIKYIVDNKIEGTVLTHKNRRKKIVSWFDNGVRPVYRVCILGHIIKATLNHPFWCGDEIGWVKLEDLKIGDKIFYYNNTKLENTYGDIKSIDYIGEESVYDIEVEDDHSFIANDFVVHNSRDPNGQNIPKRGALAKEYRKIFVPSPGYSFAEVDLSQAELRIAAWMANEKNMLRIYNEGKDIHKVIGSAAHHIEELDFEKPITFEVLEDLLVKFEQLPTDFQKQARQKAKGINFGLVYSMIAKSLVNYMKTQYGVDITEEQAEQFHRMFFLIFPGLKGWHKAVEEFVRENGYVRALHGALRRLPHVNSDNYWIRADAVRQAINSPVQKFASDISLMAMIRLTRDADPDIIRPVAFIHDALIFEIKDGHREECCAAAKFYMQDVRHFKKWFNIEPPLPIIADISVGLNLSKMDEIHIEAKQPEWFKDID